MTPRNKYYMGSQQNGEVKKREPCWLFGKITRGQSEKFLRHKELGTYLVRKSDSRDGYSLSFKAENRCRHYMVDALPNGKFIIIGEPRVHKNLKDLTDYHRNVRACFVFSFLYFIRFYKFFFIFLLVA